MKSHGKHLRRSKKVIDVEGTMTLVKPSGKHPRQSQSARPRKMGITNDMSPEEVEQIKMERLERKRANSRAWHSKFESKGVLW